MNKSWQQLGAEKMETQMLISQLPSSGFWGVNATDNRDRKKEK